MDPKTSHLTNDQTESPVRYEAFLLNVWRLWAVTHAGLGNYERERAILADKAFLEASWLSHEMRTKQMTSGSVAQDEGETC
ncbi:hypothetical protein GRAN_3150 [Granulicella sibirica]|uniref:Uncharacterized protein n=1 Tax=Granulicella sibirica TaxID=2479048 RepID=A0A4Q0SYH5_9BACT|nr:hypothetical protein GRAN_3150 [Granulicella sibirica]